MHFDSVDGGGAIVDEPVPADYVNGTRLRAYREVDGAGTGPLIDWFDSLLGTHCTFAPAADGVLRCLPSRSAQYVYQDASCTQPLAVLFPRYEASCGAGEQYARAGDGSGRVYLMGAAYGPDVYADFGFGCSATGGNNFSHLLGAEVDPTMFVGAREHLAYHGRLAAIEWVADDGARQISGTFVDQQYPPSLPDGPPVSSTTRCVLRELDPGKAYCVSPNLHQLANIAYRDPTCTQELIDVNEELTTSDYAAVVYPDLCADNPRILAVGAEYIGAKYLNVPGSGCIAASQQSYQHLYAIAGETALSAFDSFQLEVDTAGTGRLRTSRWRDADGNGPPDAAFDTVRGRRCAPVVEATSNLLTCAPLRGTIMDGLYSDAQCMTLAFSGALTCRSGLDAAYFPAIPDYTCEGDRSDIQGAGAMMSLTPLWWSSFPGKPCIAVDFARTAAVMYTGSSIPGATLPAMHEQTD